jgi:nitrogen fixation NifU-like protein
MPHDTSDATELYQEILLDHNRSPRNFGRPERADRHAEGYNPLCGDKVTVFVSMDADGTISDVHFEGSGCAISTASASLMTESVKGLAPADALALFDRVIALVTADSSRPAEPGTGAGGDLGKLEAFAGVSEYPMRVKCATLAWHTLRAALLASQGAPVTTEA